MEEEFKMTITYNGFLGILQWADWTDISLLHSTLCQFNPSKGRRTLQDCRLLKHCKCVMIYNGCKSSCFRSPCIARASPPSPPNPPGKKESTPLSRQRQLAVAYTTNHQWNWARRSCQTDRKCKPYPHSAKKQNWGMICFKDIFYKIRIEIVPPHFGQRAVRYCFRTTMW